jgi:transposase-like protein
MRRCCPNCKHTGLDKGRAFTGKRAYRCQWCGNIWTEGARGRQRKLSPQRQGYQFADTGAAKREDW